jgi:hypothetical protein
MKEYTIVPNKDSSGWYVKLEDVAPENLYDNRSIAIDEAEKLAMDNQPSKILVYNEELELVDEKIYK